MKIKNIIILFFVICLISSTVKADEKSAKNIILFIGDGMQLEHEIAGSRYLTGKDFSLSWHSFPYQTYVSTWDITTYNRYAIKFNSSPFKYSDFDPYLGYNPNLGGDKPYPLTDKINDDYFLQKLANDKGKLALPYTDSAASGTAMATGYKTNNGILSKLPEEYGSKQLKTIAEIFKEANASIGIVSTVPFNHATPAVFVSHNTSRTNYYTGKKETKETGIADEIINSTKPDVVIGGGHPLYNKKTLLYDNYLNNKLYEKIKTSNEYVFVERKPDENASDNLLNAANEALSSNKKLFGLFGDKSGSLEYAIAINKPGSPEFKLNEESPSLAASTEAALKVLSSNQNGFFLIVEQGEIDWANHYNDYKKMIGYVWDFDEAVKTAVNYIEKPNDDLDWANTLVIVTSDHANSYMRLNKEKKLSKGELPFQLEIFKYDFYPDNKVSYKTRVHTNELVMLYAKGQGKEIFRQMEGSWYPDTRIIDNTQIFDAMLNASGLTRFSKKEN